MEYRALGQTTQVKSQNRTSASSLQELSRQIMALRSVVASIPTTRQTSTTTSNFGLTSGWNNVLSASLTVPSGATRADILVMGSGQMASNTTSGSVETSYRLNLVGVGVSPTLPGAWFPGTGDFRSALTPSYSWAVGVSPGSTITAQFQVSPADPASYPTNVNSYASLTILATFSGQ